MLLPGKELDSHLLDLAWSLWTELGVAGIKRNHQKCLITLEELIVLTVTLSETDPRLRDESLDWCSQYHHFISMSRLRSVIKNFGNSLNKSFSNYSVTLNSLSRAAWPIFQDAQPFKVVLKSKSCLRSLESPALLNLRARSLFGTGARADLVTFFLTHGKTDFSASDVVKTGYSKRSISEILEEFCLSGVFNKFFMRNQQRYRLMKREQLLGILGPIPEYAPSWGTIFEVLLPLRDCLNRKGNISESTRIVEIRNLLIASQNKLEVLGLTPPFWQGNLGTWRDAFGEWLIKIASQLAKGDFSDRSFCRT
jgi:hypothetical protein